MSEWHLHARRGKEQPKHDEHPNQLACLHSGEKLGDAGWDVWVYHHEHGNDGGKWREVAVFGPNARLLPPGGGTAFPATTAARRGTAVGRGRLVGDSVPGRGGSGLAPRSDRHLVRHFYASLLIRTGSP